MPTSDPAVRSVILDGLRRLVGSARAADAPSPPATPDQWAAVLGHAEAESVAPLLYAAWRDAEFVPADMLSRLRASYIDTGSRNTLRLRDLAGVLAALAAAGIPAVVLKGAALLETVYGNPALRPMVDVDLLVHPEELERALAALAALDYRPPQVEVAPGAWLAYDNEVALLGPSAVSTPLELHWSLLNSPYYQARLDMGWFWQSARPQRVAGQPTLVLGPEAQLLHLAAHWSLHHPGEALLWQHDLAAVFARLGPQLDWPLLIERAAAQELVLPLQAAVASAHGTWGLPLPDAALAAVAALVPGRGERRIQARLVEPRRDVAHQLMWDVEDLSGWAERGRFLAQQLLPRPAYMRTRYGVQGRWDLPAAYARRWWRGLAALTRGE